MNKVFKLKLVILLALAIIILSIFLSIRANSSEVVELPNCSLKYSVETTASKSTIWKLWTDVENWKQFDTILEYSYLVDDAYFELGAIGYINANGAPKTKFEIVELKEPESFTLSLKLPLWQTMELQRYYEENEFGYTTFTHEVNFKGGLRHIYYALLASTFKKELINVMENLKEIAERDE